MPRELFFVVSAAGAALGVAGARGWGQRSSWPTGLIVALFLDAIFLVVLVNWAPWAMLVMGRAV